MMTIGALIRRICLAALLCLGVLHATASMAGPIQPLALGLYNTGVGSDGNALLPDGDLDAHYQLVSNLSNTAYITRTPNGVSWMGELPDALWITPTATPFGWSDPVGSVYDFSLVFGVAGVLPSSVSGVFAADNLAAISINGSPVFSGGNFSGLTAFSIAEGFVHGQNTIVFSVTNAQCLTCFDNPVGLLVRFDSAATSEIPEPRTLALLLATFGGIMFARVGIARKHRPIRLSSGERASLSAS
jgi:hypothetical protein